MPFEIYRSEKFLKMHNPFFYIYDDHIIIHTSEGTKVYYDAEKDRNDSYRYYQAIKDISLDNLNKLITETHINPRRYNPAKELYEWIDVHPDGELYSIYSGRWMDRMEIIEHDEKNIRKQEEELNKIQWLSPEVLEQLDRDYKLNCEHSVPQSWFGRREPQRGDLHHLFACEPKCNSYRGNHPYIENEGKKKDDCGSKEKNGFEPNASKAIVARATLYFFVRYPDVMNDTNASKSHIETLVKWSKSKEPSLYEKHRNREIWLRQGNRNPFIDYPEWVAKVFK